MERARLLWRPIRMRTTLALSAVALALLAAGCGGGTDRLATQNAATGADLSPSPSSAGLPSSLPATASRLPVPSPTPVATAGTGTATAAGSATASPVRVTVPPSPASPTPVPPADPAHLTEADSGQTIRVRVGEQVNVELPGGSGGGYHQPASSSDVMNRTAASGGYPTDQPARASFVATRAGTADLTAYDDFACLHTRPRCLPPQREWIVHVVVQ